MIPNYNSISGTEREQTVFQNLVKVDELNTDLNSVNYIRYKTDLSNLYGIVTKKDVTIVRGSGDPVYENGILKVYAGTDAEDSLRLRAVITTGNVILDGCSFNGLILSNGKITMQNSSLAASAPDEVAKVLEAENANKTKMMDYLIDAESYVIGGATSGSVSNTKSTSVEELVVYQNWVKQ